MATQSSGGHRWRDSGSGRFLKEQDARRRHQDTVERERGKTPQPPAPKKLK